MSVSATRRAWARRRIRRGLGLITWLICLGALSPAPAMAQTQASLPPAAQNMLDQGVAAARKQNYPLALHFFEVARKAAPSAPIVYLNLGLAESKIAGRELRAIAWFGAYLAANPNAPNAAAVKAEIAVLDVKVQSNISHFLKSVEAAASQIGAGDKVSGDKRSENWGELASIGARAGDIPMALKAADRIQDPYEKAKALMFIAEAQAESGAIAGAQKTAERIREAGWKVMAQSTIAIAQVGSGDLAGALRTAEGVQDSAKKAGVLSDIAIAQAGKDIAGAQKTAERIQVVSWRERVYPYIAYMQAKNGDIAGAETTAALISGAVDKGTAQRLIAFAQAGPTAVLANDYLEKLDDDTEHNPCPLNTELFLDLTGYLKSLPAQKNSGLPTYIQDATGRLNPLPTGEDPQNVFEGLVRTAGKIVQARNVITSLLKQQARQ